MFTPKLVAVVVFLLALTGCADPITKLVNSRFPPVKPGEQRQKAIDTAADALKRLTAPTIALSVSMPEAQAALNNDERLREAGITSLALSGEMQLLLASAQFARRFSGADAGNDAELRQWLERLKPEVSGRVSVYSGITSAVQSDADGIPVVALRLLPGVSWLQVDELKLADGKVDATQAAEKLVTVLSRYLQNVSGELARADFTRVTVPAVAPKPVRLPKMFTAKSITINVHANPIALPIKLDGIASIVSAERVIAVAQTSFVKADAPKAETVEVEHTFEVIEGRFQHLLRERFDMGDIESGSWVVIRKDLVATGLNTVLAQADACFSASGTPPPLRSSTKVPLPDGSDISCASDRNCSPNKSCDYDAKHDTLNCHHCLLRRPRWLGGGCVTRGNDPICEASKAAQNALYQADAAAKKFDCERNKEMSRLGCEAEKVTKKGLCEVGKETLKLISKTGNFANLDVDASFSSSNLKVCLRNFALAPAMDNVSLALEVTGGVDVGIDMKFVPLDIVGHLACQFPWTEKKTFRATLRDSLIGTASSVTLVTDAGAEPRVDFVTGVTTVKAKLSPGPTEYLLTSANMTLACQGLNLLKPLVLVLTPFIPELRGDIDHEVDSKQFSMALDLPQQSLGGQQMKVVARATPAALRLVTAPAVTPAVAASR
jgi:hypothetical protein